MVDLLYTVFPDPVRTGFFPFLGKIGPKQEEFAYIQTYYVNEHEQGDAAGRAGVAIPIILEDSVATVTS